MIDIGPPTTEKELAAAYDAAINQIEKDHGKGSIFKLGDKPPSKVAVIPTGIYTLDYHALGVGGLPRGRIIEIFGPESSGKTTLALQAVAQAQKAGGRAAFVDVEHALDPTWAVTNGVNVADLLISQPDWGEQALQITETLIASGAFSVIVVDSVAALVPKSELDGDIGDSNVGVQARLMSQAMRKFTGIVSKTNTIVIFINQIREKIGVMFGSPETTTGGRALRFYSSVRLDVRRVGQVKEGDTIIGNRTKIKIVKNKVAPPFKEVEVDLLYATGFDGVGSLFDAAVGCGVITKAGSWFSYGDEKLGQGRLNSIAALESRGVVDKVLTEVRTAEEAHV